MDASNPLDERLWRERERLFRETGIEYRRESSSIDCDAEHPQHTILYSTTTATTPPPSCRILFTHRAIADDDARRRFEQFTSLPPTRLHAVLAMDACAARDELSCLLTALGADVMRGGAANARYLAAVRAAAGVAQRPYPPPSTANALERRVARALLRTRGLRYVFGGARLLQLIDERRARVAYHFAPSGAWTHDAPAAAAPLAFVAPTNARAATWAAADVCPFIKARYWCDTLAAAVGWQWRADADAVVDAKRARVPPRHRRVLLLGTSRLRQLFETIACVHRRRLRARRVQLSDGVARRDGACQCRLRDARPWRTADDADLCPSMHESALRGVRRLYADAANYAAARALRRRRGNGTAACACDCTDNVAQLVFDNGFELHYVFRGTITGAPLPRSYDSWRGGVGPSLALDDVTTAFDAIGSDYELAWLDAVGFGALHRFHFDAFPSAFACINSSATRAQLSDMARRRTWRVPHAALLCARRDALVHSRFHRHQWPRVRVDAHMCMPGPYEAIANIFLKMLL